MEAIGGYFELELRKGEHYHKEALRLNTARNCFEYILLARKYIKVYIPYYTCEVMLEPLHKHHIAYEFYHINENLEPIEIKQLRNNEAFLYTNYFGLKQSCVEYLATIYQSQLIVDNAQAFFAPRIAGIDTFYSPRKFFGVADGGYLYSDCTLRDFFQQDVSYKRMQHLFVRIDEGAENGYSSFKENDNFLNGNPIRRMSRLTNRILQNIDYEFIKKQRRKNFIFLQEHLFKYNKLRFNISVDVPMVYPYYVNNDSLRNCLINNKIFVATYWPNVLKWCKSEDMEHGLAAYIIPLPIDQRYDLKDMDKILHLIK